MLGREGVTERRRFCFDALSSLGRGRGLWGLPESGQASPVHGGGGGERVAVISEVKRGARRASPLLKGLRGRERPAPGGAGAAGTPLWKQAGAHIRPPLCRRRAAPRGRACAPRPATRPRRRGSRRGVVPGARGPQQGRGLPRPPAAAPGSARAPRIFPPSQPPIGAGASLRVELGDLAVSPHSPKSSPGCSPAHPLPPTWSLPRRVCASETRAWGREAGEPRRDAAGVARGRCGTSEEGARRGRGGGAAEEAEAGGADEASPEPGALSLAARARSGAGSWGARGRRGARGREAGPGAHARPSPGAPRARAR